MNVGPGGGDIIWHGKAFTSYGIGIGTESMPGQFLYLLGISGGESDDAAIILAAISSLTSRHGFDFVLFKMRTMNYDAIEYSLRVQNRNVYCLLHRL
uniref:Uncharacterized protein n=1 Tax=Romanomermis culicivorax TaxID=13658 RepID=A0A915JA43_ROMCU